eukprot:4727631-Prorocentrum_lima.AAC.1
MAREAKRRTDPQQLWNSARLQELDDVSVVAQQPGEQLQGGLEDHGAEARERKAIRLHGGRPESRMRGSGELQNPQNCLKNHLPRLVRKEGGQLHLHG